MTETSNNVIRNYFRITNELWGWHWTVAIIASPVLFPIFALLWYGLRYAMDETMN